MADTEVKKDYIVVDWNVDTPPVDRGQPLRDCFHADVFIRKDSEPYDEAITKEVPYEGQIVFDRNFKSKFLQIGMRTSCAPWRLVNVQNWHIQIDSSGSPTQKMMKEGEWGLELTTPMMWLTRHINPFMDHATSQVVAGSNLGITEGPDGMAGSAVVFGATDSAVISGLNLTGDFSLLMWVRCFSPNYNLYQIGDLTISVISDGMDYVLRWNDGVNIIDIALSQDYTEWTFLSIVREGGVLRVYEQYALAGSGILAGALDFSGDLTLCEGGMQWFDSRILPRAVSAEAITYYYNDIIQHSGNSTCPAF